MIFKYRIKLSVDGTDIDKEAIGYLFPMAFKGANLEMDGDSHTVVIAFDTDEPWKVMEYCATFGEMHDVTVANLKLV